MFNPATSCASAFTPRKPELPGFTLPQIFATLLAGASQMPTLFIAFLKSKAG
jgi:hypothetical protein